ncbi:MAG: 2Fe-2S iron-sulfur cluster binding domain-containing protein [Rhodoferax sp.]|nr:2Fe-2S iron-sulfur cluster binding domain-containing protein [Rhodoferax sp.]
MTVCDALLEQGIGIDHACGKVGVCTTCHVIIVQGIESLNQVSEKEDDMLDRAWGVQPTSRLSRQAVVGTADLVADIPKYSINHAKENA